MVLGFVLSDRGDASFLRLRDEEVPPAYWGLKSFSDSLEAYAKFLPSDLHEVCTKGSGKTSIVEGLNTKWRQRQSGLVRKSCGVCWRILDDISERFLILVEQHNREQIRRWNKTQVKQMSPLKRPIAKYIRCQNHCLLLQSIALIFLRIPSRCRGQFS
jgi:IS1 family transposase